MTAKPIITNSGLFTANGRFWLISDGPFPFDNCDDRTTDPGARWAVEANYWSRLEHHARADLRRQALGMTWAQYYQADQ